jgi:hypothetical protein
MKTGVRLSGRFHTECLRDGKVIWTEDTHNLVTTEGLNAILNGCFHTAGFTVPATWFIGLVETDTAPAAGMTYDVPVFTESASYDNIAVRSTYVTVDSTAGSITNAASPSLRLSMVQLYSP